MRTRLFAAVLLVVVCVVALSATRDTAVRDALVPAPSPAEAALDRVLQEVQFENLPFEQAIARLQAAGQARLVVDWPKLHSLGFDRKAPVQLQVRGFRLSEALTRLLEQLKAPDASVALGFAPDGSAVLVSTEEALSQRVSLRCYDIRDLIPADAHVEPDNAAAIRTGGGLFGGYRPKGHGEEIAYYITETAAPDTWRENGGYPGRMTYLSGRLLVVQTWANHRQVESLLGTFRRPVPPSSGAPGVEELAWDPQLKQWMPAVPDAAERALRTVLPEVKLQNASLGEAVQTLARLARANIVLDGRSMMRAELDRKHLQDAGVDVNRGRRLTLDLYDVTLERALEAVVQAYSDNVWTGGFVPHNRAIIVTEASAATGGLFTRVYDLRDWPHVGAAVERHRRPAPVERIKTRAGEIEQLVEAVATTVAPESWRDNGGTASMLFVADRLVVTQTWRNHEQVRWFLSALRAGPSPRPTSAPGTQRRE